MMSMWWQPVVLRGEAGTPSVPDCSNTSGQSWSTSYCVLKRLDYIREMQPKADFIYKINNSFIFFFSVFALPQPSTRSLQHIYQVQLGRFFQEGEFATEVTELQLPLVSAAIAVYYRMCGSMLPTPAKSHYTFNLRDLSKVEGIIFHNIEFKILTFKKCCRFMETTPILETYTVEISKFK